MSWIDKHRNIWRIAILATAAVAMTGPWTFELVSVPSEYPCSRPYIRLEGDFCGRPVSWLRGYSWMLDELANGSEMLLRGDVSVVDWARVFLYVLPPSLFLLPLISTLVLILRGDRRRRQVFQLVAWGLAASLGMMLIGLLSYPGQRWMAWGIWLYVGSAAGALILEVLTLAAGRRVRQG
jgi:hypothetical protein